MKNETIQDFDPQVFLNSTNGARSAETYQPGQAVYEQGEIADAVFYIRKGKVQITVVSAQGKEGVTGIMDGGEFIGEDCLTRQPLRLATASAMEESDILRIEKAEMVRILSEQPSFSELFLDYMLTRTAAIEADLVDQLFNSSEKRLARVLLQLANIGKETSFETVIPEISQETLAARVGTTRSRINVFMNKFRKLGLIEYNGVLKVHPSLLDVIIHD